MPDPYRNYANLVMPVSSSATTRQWGTGGGDTLVGTGSEDTFFIYASDETVVETPGAMATVVVQTWSPYTLPANVTNMTVGGAPGTVTGNSLANLIIAQGNAGMTIDGGGGNDVLVANTGPDTFVVGQSYGHQVIYNFDPTQDAVRLAGSSVTSFAALQSSMTQQGQDVVIALAPGNDITLRNTSLGSLSAADFQLAIDPSTMKLTFDDEFNSFSSSPDGSIGWKTAYNYDTRTLSANNEAEYYSDASVGVNPFSDDNGVLTITAAPAANGQTPAGSGLSYTSGVITTYKSFAQLYGYFEVRAELPAGQGFWPAFWLLPTNGAWPPEIDVMEQIGGSPSTIFETSHTDQGGFNIQQHFNTQVTTATSAFHTYGVDWEADKITWYVDGVSVGSTATPSDMHTPMYMLLNLAVGRAGSWPGATDGTASAQMKIDYVRAYGAADVGPPAPPTVALTAQQLAADTGVSASDNVTSKGGVTLTGTVTGASGTGVTVFDGTAMLGAATLNGSGGWSYATTLASGTHALHAVATDPAGNSASSAAMPVIVVQTAPPSLAVTAETTNATGTSETIAGTVSGLAGTTVQIFNGTSALGAALLDGSGGWSFSHAFAPGPYALTAIATDPAGNAASAVARFSMPAPVSDTLVLNLAESTVKPDAQFTVSVDGKQVGGTMTVTAQQDARQAELFSLTGSFGGGTHDIAIDFLNGPKSGAATINRTLYVKSITLDGSTTTENAVDTTRDATHFAVATPSASGQPAAITTAVGKTLILDATATGLPVTIGQSNTTIQLADAQDFRGTIAGFAAADTLDLRSITFSGAANTSMLSFGGDTQSGTLQATDGVHTAHLALLGNYATGRFTAAADGHGGTAVTFVNHR